MELFWWLFTIVLFAVGLIGTIAGEFIAGKRMIDAGRAGWGSLLGNIGGMLAKLIIALAMITLFLIAVPLPVLIVGQPLGLPSVPDFLASRSCYIVYRWQMI